MLVRRTWPPFRGLISRPVILSAAKNLDEAAHTLGDNAAATLSRFYAALRMTLGGKRAVVRLFGGQRCCYAIEILRYAQNDIRG